MQVFESQRPGSDSREWSWFGRFYSLEGGFAGLDGGFGRRGLGKAECAGEDEIREAEEEQEGFEIVVQGRLGDCKGDPGEEWRN